MIRILESNPDGYQNFLDLDWILFSLQPDPETDYPNENNCDNAKKLILTNSCMRKNYYI